MWVAGGSATSLWRVDPKTEAPPRRSRSARPRAASSPTLAGSGRAQKHPPQPRTLSLCPPVPYHRAMGPGPRLSLLALGAGVAVLVSAALPSSTGTSSSAAFASSHGESKGGGTLRLMWGAEPRSLDPAIGGPVGSGILLNATCAKLFRDVYDPDTGKVRVVPEVAEHHPLGRRPHVHLRAQADVPLRHRRARDRAELRRRVQPQRQQEVGLAGGTPHAGDHRGRRSHAGNGEDRLGRGAARRLPPPHPSDASRGRPRRSPDDAVLLPDPRGTPPTARSMFWMGRGRTTSLSASSAGASSSNGISTTAVGPLPSLTASSGRSSPTSPRKSGRPSRARTTSRRCSPGRTSLSAASSPVRQREPARSSRPPRFLDPFELPLRVQHRSASVQGSGQPRLGRRSTTPSTAGPDPCSRLPGSQGERPPATGSSAAPTALSARRAASRHGTKVARARRASADDAHPLHGQLPVERIGRSGAPLQPEAAQDRPQGEALRARDTDRESQHTGRAVGLCLAPRAGAAYPDPAGAFGRLVRGTSKHGSTQRTG